MVYNSRTGSHPSELTLVRLSTQLVSNKITV